MLNFYDFEVFKHDWLVVIINPIEKTKTIIINDKEKLKSYYEQHQNEIWLGYNSRNYDSYILKGILLDFDPYDISNHIVEENKKGWQYSNLFRKISLNDYDVMKRGEGGLKTLEAFMGNDIQETSVDFKLDRKLTEEEIQETIKYCTHDVEQLIEVFLQKKNDFDAHMGLIKTFDLPLSYISKTQAQLSAIILNCVKQERDDKWDIQLVPTLKINKYKHIVDWFMNPENYNENSEYKVDVCGVPHKFGWGGIHGAPKEPLHRKGLLIHVDVNSFYPAIMIEYNLLTRNCKEPEKYKQIRDYRLQLKKEGKKKEQAPYKIILNSTYGICNDVYNAAYDPRQAHNICVNGQLLLVDLLEHLEGHCELIQSNTDGLFIQIPDTDAAFDEIDNICYEWEKRTKMSLGFDVVTEIWQKDVNNYIAKFENGKLETKGAYVKELNPLDYDLPIVNEALINYLTKNIAIEKTINDCEDLIKFQKIVKITNNYWKAWHNGKFLDNKTFRVFASKNKDDSHIGKSKTKGATIEKFANTPEHCFINNTCIKNEKVCEKLNKQWYIDIASERLKQFGVIK